MLAPKREIQFYIYHSNNNNNGNLNQKQENSAEINVHVSYQNLETFPFSCSRRCFDIECNNIHQLNANSITSIE